MDSVHLNYYGNKIMQKQLKNLQDDAVNASKIMGVKEIEFLDFPDNEMDKISNLELTTKIDALCAYKTEIKDFPHPRSSEGLEVIAKHWGTVSGFHAAEAFYLVRQLKSNI